MGREFPTMEDELELSLELSIGGCYAKSETKSLEREKGTPSDDSSREIPRSDFAQNDAAAENGCDLQKRREMQAMKRREARMKRDFKKSRGMNGGGEDRVAAEAQRAEERERDGAPEEPAPKREKSGNASSFGENKVLWGAQFRSPVGNGFACPWVVPLLAAGEGGERNTGEELPASSSGRRSSSHHRSTSQKGGSSSDTGSHSSSFGTHQNDKVEINNSSSRAEPPCWYQDQSTKAAAIQRPQSDSGQGSLTDTTCSTTDKLLSSPTSSVINPPPKVSNPGRDGTALPLQMPCVSTTGNGPNGRTITGFLYKYTKSEVSIMCVCHGSFFSPAEFVEHAGGVDVTHPLRHITVVPSAVR